MNNEYRELLELAAKAAKIKGEYVCNGCEGMSWIAHKDCMSNIDYYWNPLTDDGDALRLAVKLGINVRPYGLDGCAVAHGPTDSIYIVQENYTTNKYAATRLAIVRAAAEIGKEML